MDLSQSLNFNCKTGKTFELALEHREEYDQHHCERVANLAVQAGVVLGMDDDSLYQLEAAAIFHDIGKIGIADEILLNVRHLSPAQNELLKTHTLIGASIAEKLAIPDAHKVAKIIRHHHEYVDGSGYPYGLKGEDIPLASRIICVIDSFDSLSAEQSYQNQARIEKILDIMKKDISHKFDPDVFECVAALIKTMTSLSTEE